MAHAMMVRLQSLLADIREREEGQGLVEYVVLIGLIALAVFAAVTFFENEISTTFSEIANSVQGTLPGGGDGG